MHGKNFNASWDPGGEQNVVATKPSELSSPDQSQALTLSSSALLQAVRARCQYGPRWLRQRWLDDLKPWQIADLHLADEEARRMGLPLNTFITIAWHLTFPGFSSMPMTFRAGMNRMGVWLRRQGVPQFAWIYVHENPAVSGTEDTRPNTHILVHIPRRVRCEFQYKVSDWFEACEGGLDVRRRRPGPGVLHYMSKGAGFLVCRKYGGYRARRGQGRIEIKRSGAAQCLRVKQTSKQG